MNSNSDGSTPMIEGGRLLAGRYRLLEKIGEGGAAEVFRARDQRLDRIVAIKLLRPQYMHDQASRSRFGIEAKAAAKLSHPNIVDIYDFGEAPDGTMFIAMQYLDGQNLKDFLQKRGRMSPSEVISVARQVCHALTVAHNSGLVHRDVKPQNIMIDRKGDVRLTDFGIVKALSGPALTQSGMTFGTAAYLSPEQATGAPVGPVSDIYALGCVMYEMLSGTPPLTGENPAVVAYKQVWEQPRPLHDLVPEVLPSLESVVMRCLNKDPERRYPSAEALAAEMDRLSNAFNQPTQAVSLGALAAAKGVAGEYTPVSSRAPAELSQVIPVQEGAPETNLVPVARAQTGPHSSIPVPHVPPPRTTAYSPPQRPVTQARSVQVVEVERRGFAWLPFALVALLGLGLLGLAFWQGRNILGGTPDGITPTVEVTATAEQPVAQPTAVPPSPSPLPSPTQVLGGVVIGSPAVVSPVPLPTNTSIPPTDTPVPPTPTDTPVPPTPAPEVSPTPLPGFLPTDTPVPPEEPSATPEIIIQPTPVVEQDTPTPETSPQANTVVLQDSLFQGGSRGTYHNVSAAWVYGQGTQLSRMSATFSLNAVPQGPATLTLVGVDSEDSGKMPMSITLNGALVYSGADPLPNDNANGPKAVGNWGSFSWLVAAGVLQPGSNTLTITNLSPSGCVRCPAFIMLDYATVTW